MEFRKSNLLGINVYGVTYGQIVQIVVEAIRQRKKTTLFAVNVHNFIKALSDENYRLALNSATITYPDGVPILWASKLLIGEKLQQRIFGPELMLRALSLTKYANFILGGTQRELDRAKANLIEMIPGVNIVGTMPDLFRKLSEEEEDERINVINKTRPDILWVVLGAPKQEIWAYRHKDKLNVPVIAPVGAAIKYHAKIIRKSPAWMHNYGLEWAWRLFQEPRWLWRRYLFTNTQFIWIITKELFKKNFCRR